MFEEKRNINLYICIGIYILTMRFIGRLSVLINKLNKMNLVINFICGFFYYKFKLINKEKNYFEIFK